MNSNSTEVIKRLNTLKKVKADIALPGGNPTSELWDHTVLHRQNVYKVGIRWYSICLPRKDGRQSWPSSLESTPGTAL